MKQIKKLLAALLIAAICLSMAVVALAESGTVWTTGNVNLRKGPGMNYAVLEQVPIGETVGVLDVCMDGKGADGWNKVQRGQIIGYMMRKFLRENSEDVPPWEPPVDTTAGAVTVDRGTLRALRFQVLALADKLKALAGDTDE